MEKKTMSVFDVLSMGTQAILVHKGEKCHTFEYLKQEAALAKQKDCAVVASTNLKGHEQTGQYYFQDKEGVVRSARIYK